MTDVFISYARVNRETAQAVAMGLEAAGLAVWWDRELTGGGDFAAEIEQQLLLAPVTLVLWSAASVRSDFVRDESGRARDLDRLLPVRVEAVPLPLGFGTLHTLELLDWDGDPESEDFVKLCEQVRARVAAARAAGPATPQGGPPRRLAAQADEPGSDPLGRQRQRRQWLTRLGGVAVLAVGGGTWLTWRSSQRREALAHLNRGLGYQFAEMPAAAQAQVEYRLATQLDPDLAEAFYYWAHLAVADMSRSAPPFVPGEREGLQQDAVARFTRALARPELLGSSRTAVARQHLALLAQEDAAPVARAAAGPAPVGAEPVAAAPTPAPADSAEPGGTASDSPSTAAPAASPSPTPAAPASGPTTSGAVPVPRPAPAPAATAPPAPPPPSTEGRLVRLAASPERAQQARQLAQALFADSRDARLAAQSALALDPALSADALPTALALAQAGPAGGAGAEAWRMGLLAVQAGLARATPAVLQPQRAALDALLSAGTRSGVPDGWAASLRDAISRAESGAAPVLYLQVAHPRQLPLARQLAARFSAAGYRVPPIETTGEARAPRLPELRSHGGSDPGLARWCQQALATATGAQALWQPLRQVQARSDTFEIWLDAGLCAPGGRQAPGCSS